LSFGKHRLRKQNKTVAKLEGCDPVILLKKYRMIMYSAFNQVCLLFIFRRYCIRVFFNERMNISIWYFLVIFHHFSAFFVTFIYFLKILSRRINMISSIYFMLRFLNSSPKIYYCHRSITFLPILFYICLS
jgi:hypothetical protein